MPWKRHIPEKGKIVETTFDPMPRMDRPGGHNVVRGIATGEVQGKWPTMICDGGQERAISMPWRYCGEGEDAWRERYWED